MRVDHIRSRAGPDHPLIMSKAGCVREGGSWGKKWAKFDFPVSKSDKNKKNAKVRICWENEGSLARKIFFKQIVSFLKNILLN